MKNVDTNLRLRLSFNFYAIFPFFLIGNDQRRANLQAIHIADHVLVRFVYVSPSMGGIVVFHGDIIEVFPGSYDMDPLERNERGT